MNILMTQTFTIGQAAERTGLSVHTLRFYERENLLVSDLTRTSSGRRRYTQTDIDWLEICVRLRESGMPLAQLAEFAALVRQGPGNEVQRLELLRRHEAHVRAQLASLQHCLDVIEMKVAIYETQVEDSSAHGLWDPTASQH
ncbi:MerR family transcriptional regulator [Mycobacterium sp. SMC-17]|uniref:MerR family transcriptional regulator n=1 Tax=Mycobacterium sp. SMC-17 TaxID=3381628 RepID=UPI0038773039